MKNKLKTGLLLLVACITISSLSGCKKDKPPVEEDPVACSLWGTIAELPGQCKGFMSGTLGIRGNDGKYYLIREDRTGSFANYQEGQVVMFGYTSLTGPCTLTQSCNGPGGDYCITLTCIKPGRICGTEPACNIPATVVQQRYNNISSVVGPKMVKIDGKHFLVTGDYYDEFQTYPAGAQIHISYRQNYDCVISAVVTIPNTDGCVEITCLSKAF